MMAPFGSPVTTPYPSQKPEPLYLSIYQSINICPYLYLFVSIYLSISVSRVWPPPYPGGGGESRFESDSQVKGTTEGTTARLWSGTEVTAYDLRCHEVTIERDW